MEDVAELFGILSDQTRLRIVVLLAERGETCVCKLAGALAAPQFRISRHLRILRAAGLVEFRREGTWIHYRLSEPRTPLERCLHACFRDCLRRDPVAREDLERLSAALCPSASQAVSSATRAGGTGDEQGPLH